MAILKHRQSHGGKGDANTRINKAKFDSGYDAIDWGKDRKPEAVHSQEKAKRKELPLSWLV